MSWDGYINGFQSFLMLEKGLSDNTIEAYLRDVDKLREWAGQDEGIMPGDLKYSDLEYFVQSLYRDGLDSRTTARVISGVRAFYAYLILENIIDQNPAELLEVPKISRRIPDILSVSEMESVLQIIDLSHPQGHRNRAILETLYACGLRVSELINLRISQYFPDLDMVRVIGKNNKERIIPIGRTAQKYIDIYVQSQRNKTGQINKTDADILFLNRRGKKLSRVMIYNIIKDAAAKAGVSKNISPHTFRHSFATHLIEGGADLKVVQDLLGHESITTTEIYTHLDTHYLRETILRYHPRSK